MNIRFSKLRFQLLILMGIRVLVNTPHRMVYPFLDTFTVGLGISQGTFSALLAGRSLLGTSGPFLAGIGDRWGRRRGMLAGISLFSLGVLIVALKPGLGTFLLGMMLAALGKYALDPAMLSFMGDRVPLERRGQAVAIVELGWSLGFLVGVPIAGWLIGRGGWMAPFPAFVLMGLASLGLLLAFFDNDTPSGKKPAGILNNTLSLLQTPVARAGILIGFFISAANEFFSVVFGVWLGDVFGLQLAALAGASFLIGGSELLGESLVGFWTDRLGITRAVGLGIILNSFTALALPFFSGSPVLAFTGLFLFYVTFEFTLVSSLALITELSAGARATLMGLNLSALSIGRALSDLVALPVYSFGLAPIMLGTILFNLAALYFLRHTNNLRKETIRKMKE